jgi:hypothetical protein
MSERARCYAVKRSMRGLMRDKVQYSHVSNLLTPYATRDRICHTTVLATVQCQYFENKMCIKYNAID